MINPRVPHLGCSPDRRVYDPSESSPPGLFEIKCSMAEELKDIKYLKKNPTTGVYSLKKSHQYYFQVVGCVELTGEGWSDFFVQCKNATAIIRRSINTTFPKDAILNSKFKSVPSIPRF